MTHKHGETLIRPIEYLAQFRQDILIPKLNASINDSQTWRNPNQFNSVFSKVPIRHIDP